MIKVRKEVWTCFSRSLAALFAALLSLSFFSVPARAGYYEASYSGGKTVLFSYGVSSTYNYALNSNNGTWGGGGTAYWPPVYTGSVQCQGTITTAFTWHPDSPDDLPPPAAIVQQTCGATWSVAGTGSSSSNDGLGDPQVSNGTSYGSSSGTHYLIKQNPGRNFTIDCTPAASVGGTGSYMPPIYGYGTASVQYSAIAWPVQIVLDGVTHANGVDNILIGQGCQAHLVAGAPVTFQNHSWTVSGGTFSSYEAHGGPDGFSKLNPVLAAEWTQTSPHWYWYTDEDESVACTADVYDPNNINIGSVSVTHMATAWCPYYFCGYVAGGVWVTNSGSIWLKATNLNTNPASSGISWTGRATPQYLFANSIGQGIWAFVQTIHPGRSYKTDDDVTHVWSINGLLGLDTSYPYAPDGGVLAADDSNAGIPDGDSNFTSGDSPGMSLSDAISSVTINEDFKTYMVYRPADVGSGNQWVPLHRISWNWAASITRPYNPAATPSASWQNAALPWSVGTVGVSEDARCKTHPIWNRVLFASAPFIP